MRCALVLLLIACGGAEPPTTPVDSPKTSPSSATPSGEKKWVLTGSAKTAYEAVPDPDAKEAATVVRPIAQTENRYVSLIKNYGSVPFLGKKVRIVIHVKTTGATGRAEVWARAVAPDSPLDTAGLGGAQTKLEPTTEMKPYELTLTVPAGAKWVQYGVGLAGPGSFSVGADTIEVVSP